MSKSRTYTLVERGTNRWGHRVYTFTTDRADTYGQFSIEHFGIPGQVGLHTRVHFGDWEYITKFYGVEVIGSWEKSPLVADGSNGWLARRIPNAQGSTKASSAALRDVAALVDLAIQTDLDTRVAR